MNGSDGVEVLFNPHNFLLLEFTLLEVYLLVEKLSI